jgi:hypothetical protein
VNTSKGGGSDGVGRKLGIWTGCQAQGGTARASGLAIAEVVNTSKGSGSAAVGRKLDIGRVAKLKEGRRAQAGRPSAGGTP